MKSVQCPVCHNQMYSDSFEPGEHFPCPQCEYELEVDVYDEIPKVRLPEALDVRMNWAKVIWKGGRLLLTQQKLAILGEMVVKAFELEKWPGETFEQLQLRQKKWADAEELLINSGNKGDIVEFGRTLLDIFINLRAAEPNEKTLSAI